MVDYLAMLFLQAKVFIVKYDETYKASEALLSSLVDQLKEATPPLPAQPPVGYPSSSGFVPPSPEMCDKQGEEQENHVPTSSETMDISAPSTISSSHLISSSDTMSPNTTTTTSIPPLPSVSSPPIPSADSSQSSIAASFPPQESTKPPISSSEAVANLSTASTAAPPQSAEILSQSPPSVSAAAATPLPSLSDAVATAQSQVWLQFVGKMGSRFTISLPSTSTLADLRMAIHSRHPSCDPSSQILFIKGKKLVDEMQSMEAIAVAAAGATIFISVPTRAVELQGSALPNVTQQPSSTASPPPSAPSSAPAVSMAAPSKDQLVQALLGALQAMKRFLMTVFYENYIGGCLIQVFIFFKNTLPPFFSLSLSLSLSLSPTSPNLHFLFSTLPHDVFVAAFQTVVKVVSNIVQNPGDARYRRLRKSNPLVFDRLLKHAGGEAVLQ